jgi:hypothetical protein
MAVSLLCPTDDEPDAALRELEKPKEVALDPVFNAPKTEAPALLGASASEQRPAASLCVPRPPLAQAMPSPFAFSPAAPNPSSSSAVDRAGVERLLEQEEAEARGAAAARKRHLRDAETLTADMVEDLVEMLQLFGLPYLIAPSEAEAQCAALEMLGVVDGVVTEDSDTFLFGARTIYKNLFDDKRFVEVKSYIPELCSN